MSEPHTPGPWCACEAMPDHRESRGGPRPHAHFACACRLTVWGVDQGGCQVAIRDVPYTDADARLIVAAPLYHEEAYALAMLVLQSPLYHEQLDVRDAVDAVLAVHRLASR